jgi:hypothetical protein
LCVCWSGQCAGSCQCTINSDNSVFWSGPWVVNSYSMVCWSAQCAVKSNNIVFWSDPCVVNSYSIVRWSAQCAEVIHVRWIAIARSVEVFHAVQLATALCFEKVIHVLLIPRALCVEVFSVRWIAATSHFDVFHVL